MRNSTSSTFNIVFHMRNLGQKVNKKLPVYARITINGRRIELSSKQMINPENWDENRGLAKPINEECIKLNNYLEELRNAFIACYREMYLHKKEITTETFKRTYYGVKDDEYTLATLMNYHNIDMKEALSRGTMKNYYTTQKYLEKFLKEKKHKTDVFLNEINYKFITDFEYYLKTYKPVDHQKRLGNNGDETYGAVQENDQRSS